MHWQTLQEKYNGIITSSVTLTSEETGKESHILTIVSKMSWKVGLFLGNDLIEFSTPSGKEKWIHGWWLLHGTSLLLVDDCLRHSLWIYRLDGSPAVIEFSSSFNTAEIVYRVEKDVVNKVRWNSFLLDPAIWSLVSRPAYWPE